MKKRHLCVLFISLNIFLLVLGAAFEKAEAQAFKRVNEHDMAPLFTINDVAGKEYKLVDYKGKVTGIIFWKNPSLRCAEELAILQQLYQKYNASKGLNILAIYVPQSDEELPAQEIESMKKVIADNGITYPNLVDVGMKVFSQYGVITFPSYAVIKEDGRIGVILPVCQLSAGRNFSDATRNICWELKKRKRWSRLLISLKAKRNFIITSPCRCTPKVL